MKSAIADALQNEILCVTVVVIGDNSVTLEAGDGDLLHTLCYDDFDNNPKSVVAAIVAIDWILATMPVPLTEDDVMVGDWKTGPQQLQLF